MTSESLHQAPDSAAWKPLQGKDGSEFLPPGQARGWALVLAARGIPYRCEVLGAGWRLQVPEEQLPQARAQIARFERENRNWPPNAPHHPPLQDNTQTTLAVLALLVAFANLTGLDLGERHLFDWTASGSADAGRILSGELWRTITALTLHVDWLHLAGNVVFGGLVIDRLAREVGSGLAWCLALASGTLGNLLNAWLHSPDHRAIGASTAVFGVIGILAGLNLVRYRTILWRRWALPLVAACGLLAMLGSSGERTDLGAHLFGLVAGLGLGAGCAPWLHHRGRPGPWVNRFLALAAILAVTGAWWAALASVS